MEGKYEVRSNLKTTLNPKIVLSKLSTINKRSLIQMKSKSYPNRKCIHLLATWLIVPFRYTNCL